jgi:hypothetical protein
MAADPPSRSSDLDEVRKLLFPGLPVEEGWAKIDAAIEGAADEQRLEAIEDLVAGDLTEELIAALRRLRASDRS